MEAVTVVALVKDGEAADVALWPRSIDLMAHAWCLVEDNAGSVYGGRWVHEREMGRPLKELAQAVGRACRETLGAEETRLVGPTRTARVYHSWAKWQREVGA